MKLRNSKILLAKLLAQEDIYVRQASNVRTASFNLKTRVLLLPLWEGISEEHQDMLIGHETGHALYTDAKMYADQIDWLIKNTKLSPEAAASAVNIVEDIRIDKIQQRKYPGLCRDYAIGYREWHDKDFFGVNGAPYNTFGFMDRLNLYYKGGYDRFIPFSDEEMNLVKKAKELENQKEVLGYIKKVLRFIESIEQKNENKEFFANISKLLDLDEEQEEDEEAFPSTPNIVDQKEITDEDREALKKATKGKINKDPDAGFMQLLGGITDSNAEQSLSKKIKKDGIIDHTRNPYFRLNNSIYPGYEDYRKILKNFRYKVAYNTELFEKAEKRANAFLKREKGAINYMWKEYEIKKQADIYAKTRRNTMGTLDMNRLHNYKTSDEVFRIGEIIPKGKSHGVLLFVDFSGSMTTTKRTQALKQALSLALFCQKAGVAFDVYLFTGGIDQFQVSALVPENTNNKEITIRSGLINVLSSRMTAQDFKFMRTCCFILMQEPNKLGYQQGSTPLNAILLAHLSIIPDFRKMYGSQEVVSVILSDGVSDSLSYGNCNIEHKGRVYNSMNTRECVRIVKDNLNVKMVSFFIGSPDEAAHIHNSLMDNPKRYNEIGTIFGYTPLKDTVYDEFYFMGESYTPLNNKTEENDNYDLWDDEDDDEEYNLNSNLEIDDDILEKSRNLVKERIILKSFIDTLTNSNKMG